MGTEKFLSSDRQLVIEELEKIQKTKLLPFKSGRKLFVDEKGMIYFIFGGTGDWHGVSESAMKELDGYSKEGAFVIAKKYRSRIDVCVGSLSLLIANFGKLTPTKQNGKQFHTTVTEDGMFIEEAPDIYLNTVSQVSKTMRNWIYFLKVSRNLQ